MAAREFIIFIFLMLSANEIEQDFQNWAYLKSIIPFDAMNQTEFCLQPFTAQFEEIQNWWASYKTREFLINWFFQIETNQWNTDFWGNCWINVIVNGNLCRISFYSRSKCPHRFEELEDNRNYMILVNPSFALLKL